MRARGNFVSVDGPSLHDGERAFFWMFADGRRQDVAERVRLALLGGQRQIGRPDWVSRRAAEPLVELVARHDLEARRAVLRVAADVVARQQVRHGLRIDVGVPREHPRSNIDREQQHGREEPSRARPSGGRPCRRALTLGEVTAAGRTHGADGERESRAKQLRAASQRPRGACHAQAP